jgi:hypothetical protein
LSLNLELESTETLELLDCQYSFSIKVITDDILAFSKTIDGLKKIEQIILEKA